MVILRERASAKVYRTARGILKVSPSAERERLIYEEVLPFLPFPHVRLLDRGEGWLLLEEVSGEPYGARHREAGARWMAALHGVPRPRGLPDRVVDLEPARRVLRRGLENPRLDRGVVETLLEASEGACDFALPPALVHGDFWPCNVVVRDGQVLAFDWEHAAWGCPLVDLAEVDWAVYEDLRRVRIPAQARRQAWILHAMQALPGEEPVVGTPWVDRLGRKLRYYAEALDP